jgi:tetratricopeptide (TPR) repeat protein
MRLLKFLLIFVIIGIFAISCTPPEEKAEEYYSKGMKIFYKNDPKNALVEFEKGLKYDPNHDRLLYQSGNCYMNFHDYHTAIDFYTKAIKSNPKAYNAYFNRGQCWFYLQDRDKSCADWLKADSLGRHNMADYIKHCK